MKLLALVSHELRTPLTVNIGMASFLERHTSHERSRAEAAQMLVSASRRMEGVMENMLQFSHLEHDRADADSLLAHMLANEALTRFGRDFPAAEAHQLPDRFARGLRAPTGRMRHLGAARQLRLIAPRARDCSVVGAAPT